MPTRRPCRLCRYGRWTCSRTATRAYSRPRPLFEGATALFGTERVGELLELALEDALELVRRQLDAVVGDSVLGKVVGADLLGALARADLRPARGVELGLLLLALDLVQASAQHAQRLLAVLELALLVLHRHDEAGWKVRDADGRVGRVDALSAGTGRAVHVHLQLVRIDLDFDVLRLRHHGDGRGRRVDAPLRLGLGHALNAMRAALPFEDGEGAVALDRERHLLEAPGLVRARAERFDVETAALGVARQSPLKIGRPQRGLVAADALADLDDHVLAVGRIGRGECEPKLVLERPAALFELGDELPQVAVATGSVEVVTDLAPFLREPMRRFELLQPPSGGRCFPAIVVDRRIGHTLLRLLVRAFELLDELLDVTGHRRHQVSGLAGSTGGALGREQQALECDRGPGAAEWGRSGHSAL